MLERQWAIQVRHREYSCKGSYVLRYPGKPSSLGTSRDGPSQADIAATHATIHRDLGTQKILTISLILWPLRAFQPGLRRKRGDSCTRSPWELGTAQHQDRALHASKARHAEALQLSELALHLKQKKDTAGEGAQTRSPTSRAPRV